MQNMFFTPKVIFWHLKDLRPWHQATAWPMQPICRNTQTSMQQTGTTDSLLYCHAQRQDHWGYASPLIRPSRTLPLLRRARPIVCLTRASSHYHATCNSIALHHILFEAARSEQQAPFSHGRQCRCHALRSTSTLTFPPAAFEMSQFGTVTAAYHAVDTCARALD